MPAAWAASTNDTIDATHHAYWTPAADANGTLDAFAVVARDNLGAESTGNVTAQIAVTPVNDAPTLTTFAATIDTTNEDTEVEITLAELVVESYPAVEMVRFVSSGTEAVMAAVRLARGFTGDQDTGHNNNQG